MMVVSSPAPPRRREHPFINHSQQSYDAKIGSQQLTQKSPSRTLTIAQSNSQELSKRNLELMRNEGEPKIKIGSSEIKEESILNKRPDFRPQVYQDQAPANKYNTEATGHKRKGSTGAVTANSENTFDASDDSECDHPSSPLSSNTKTTDGEMEASQLTQESGGMCFKAGDSSSMRASSQELSQLSQDHKEPPRKRRRTSPDELQILEREFAHNTRPCKEDRERIAALTSKDEKAVQVWFQNKRQSCRRQQSGLGMMPAMVRTSSMPLFQDENQFARYPMMTQPQPSANQHTLGPLHAGEKQTNLSNNLQAKRSKSLKLAMSADGKAEIVERSPLKVLNHNTVISAQRFATMPAFTPNLNGFEQECAGSLLVLKSGQWR